MSKFDLTMMALPVNGYKVGAPPSVGRPRIPATQLAKYRITSRSQVAKPEPSLYIRDAVVAVRGDLAIISGPAKAGKSAVCLNMLASALLPDDSSLDTLGIRVPYAAGKPVLYIDTEQGDYAVAGMLAKLCAMLGVTQEPDNLHLLSLREATKEEAYSVIMSYLEECKTPHFVIIDGIGDLVGSVNDEVESIRILRDFMAQASRLKTTIVTVLHDSHANSGKPRGHLGSEAERKAGGLIAVTMEQGCRCIVARKLRHSANFEPVPFTWCGIVKRFISMEPSAVPVFLPVDHAVDRKAEAMRLASQCFPADQYEMRSKELLNRIMTIQNCGQSAAYKRREVMEEHSFINPRKEGTSIYYSLKPSLRLPADPQTGLLLA